MDYIKIQTLIVVVDWVEIEISLLRSTNLKAMRSALVAVLNVRSPYAEVCSEDANSATVFRFRIQDPGKMLRVRDALERLEAIFPFAIPPTITAAEIALDDYSGGPEQVAAWYHGLTRLAAGNGRLYHEYRGSGMAIPRHRDSLARHLRDGYQLGIGDKDGEFFQHAYYKTFDNNIDLDPSEHRARYEIRLRGRGLPCTSLDDWDEFRFEALADWFRFRAVKDGLPSFDKMILNAHGQMGKRAPRNRREGGTRLHARGTIADPSNERIRNALRTLSRRWKSSVAGRPAGSNARVSDAAVASPLAEIRATFLE